MTMRKSGREFFSTRARQLAFSTQQKLSQLIISGRKTNECVVFFFCSSMPNVSEAEVKSLGLCESSANGETFSLIIHAGEQHKTDELSDRALC